METGSRAKKARSGRPKKTTLREDKMLNVYCSKAYSSPWEPLTACGMKGDFAINGQDEDS